MTITDRNETTPERKSSLSGPQDAAALHRLGRECFEAGDWKGALDAYSSAIEKDPGKPDLHYRLGCVYAKLNDWQAAEHAFQAAAELDHTRGIFLFNLGNALQKQGKLEESGKAFLSALPLYSLNARSGDPSAFFGWSWLLLECGYPADALKTVIEAARVLGPCAKVEVLMRKICTRLADQGNVYSALEGLESMRSLGGFDDMVLGNYVWLCWMYAVFEDKALTAAREVLSGAGGGPMAKEAALDLLFVFYGPSPGLVEDAMNAIAASDNPFPNLVLTVAAMLFSLNEEQKLNDLYLQFPQLKEYCGEAPAVAYAFLNSKPFEYCPETRALALETMAAYDSVKKAEKEVWERISDPSLSMAIVGNSRREIGGKRGKEIDSHDLVIRFNNFFISPPYDVDYGRKVDVIVRRCDDLPELDTYCKSRDVILMRMRLLDTYRNWGLIRRLISQDCRVTVFPSQLQEQLLHIHRRAPSAGLTFTWIAAKLRQDPANISHYGFSLVDQIGANRSSMHYFEQSAPSLRHDWVAEADLFQSITGITLGEPSPLQTYAEKVRIRLTGDHSVGGAAVEYLKTVIEPLGILTEESGYDILIVNGEGGMHHDSRNFRKKMGALCEAIGRGKKAYLVNTVWQSNPGKYDHILKHLDGIVVREQSSHEDLLKNHGVESLVRLDVSYWADVDETAPFQDLEEEAAVGDFYSQEFETFVRLTGGPLKDSPFIDMSKTNWSSLVKTLRTSSLLVTGRHHGVLAACRARIPFVALRGNTHKIEGMVRMSGLPLPVCFAPQELPEKIQWAQANRSIYEEYFQWMDEQPRFRLEDLHLG